MSDLQLPDRLVQLRTRWEADPASRIFLQLSEEYRHLGRLHEALTVLDAGLKEHPGYLSALVAKGRCLLELGQADPAREVLERVVRQDATQAVANKLLVRAYLDTGQAERAKERLDLYSLLHDGDPEIEDLRGRIRRLDAAARGKNEKPEKPEMPEKPLAAKPLPEDPFDLAAPKPAPAPAASVASKAPITPKGDGDIFQLDYPAAPRRAAVQDIFALDDFAPAPIPAPTAAAPALAIEAPAAVEEAPDLNEVEPTPEGEPFPGLVSRAVRRRYLSGLAAEGLFPVAVDLGPALPAASAPPAPPEPAAFDLEPLANLEPVAAPAPWAPEPVAEPVAPVAPVAAAAPVELFPLRSIGEAVEAELWHAEPEPPEPPEPVVAAPRPVEPPVAPQPEPAAPVAAAPAVPAAPPELHEVPETATVTLADLYLRQGHHGEAERLYQEVLRREPDNAGAQLGLARVASASASPVSAASEASAPAAAELAPTPQVAEPVISKVAEPALEPALPAPIMAADFVAPGSAGDRRTRTVDLLNRYLQRIRRGSQPHVP